MSRPEWLTAAVQRSEDEDWTLGFIFKRYRQFKNKTNEALAEELGCSLETLDWLALCRVPDEETFATDLDTLARRFELEPDRLAPVLRLAKMLQAFAARRQNREADDTPELMPRAARDRVSEEDDS
jgi:hypothetical protein